MPETFFRDSGPYWSDSIMQIFHSTISQSCSICFVIWCHLSTVTFVWCSRNQVEMIWAFILLEVAIRRWVGQRSGDGHLQYLDRVVNCIDPSIHPSIYLSGSLSVCSSVLINDIKSEIKLKSCIVIMYVYSVIYSIKFVFEHFCR